MFVNIRNSHFNTYLRGYPDGKVDVAGHCDAWQIWRLQKIGTNWYSLRSTHQTYLRGSPTQKIDLAPHCAGWEQWIINRASDSQGPFYIQSQHGTFLISDNVQVKLLGNLTNNWGWIIQDAATKKEINL